TVTFKRHQDDEDEDDEPFAGSNRGSREEELEKNLSQLVHQRRRFPCQLASLKKGPNLIKSLLVSMRKKRSHYTLSKIWKNPHIRSLI
ncbi:hypothetical protein Tco_0506908, partial [Tanacetum coccineum]